MWNAETGEQVKLFTDHSSFVDSAMFSADSLLVASTSEGETIYWEALTGKHVDEFTPPPSSPSFPPLKSKEGFVTVSTGGISFLTDCPKLIRQNGYIVGHVSNQVLIWKVE